MTQPRFFIYAYNNGSASARALANALPAKIIRHEVSKYKNNPNDFVINWGSSSYHPAVEFIDFNTPNFVSIVANKLHYFQYAANSEGPGETPPRLVPWTTSIVEADVWLSEDATVVARTILTGHGGSGIVVVSPGEMLPDAPLYTKYIKKDSEWRVHCYKDKSGEVKEFYVQRKVKDPSIAEPKTWLIRNHDNGFIFQHENLTAPEDVLVQARLALVASGLDFGAVDVIFNKHEQKAFVLEVNSAPGLTGVSVEKYVLMFKSLI